MIPIKPSESTFTDAQWEAIWVSGQDTLVSAAAGSGKTEVLITRMIEKVTDAQAPIDVDTLLVVTFTSAAAAEMRNRMAAALERAVTANPSSEHLRKQLTLVNKAQISTLHAFCQHVVRQYAYLIDVDPGFRVADETETTLIREDVIRQVLEQAYEGEQQEGVYRLADSFTSDRDDQALEKLINRLYNYARVHPSPEKWLHSIPAHYQLPEECEVEDLSFIAIVNQAIEHQFMQAQAILQEALVLARLPEGPFMLEETLLADEQLITRFFTRFQEEGFQGAYHISREIKWVRAASVKGEEIDEVLAKEVKTKRDEVKKIVKQLQENYFMREPQQLLNEIRSMAPSLEQLIELVLQFGQQFTEAKKERGVVDFSDLEHLALSLLGEERNGVFTPTAVAKEYQNRFEEILVDEYQDTNILQETIIQLIKRSGDQSGNLFMVGDVKQSIYGFRLAEPQLFLEKYKRFEKHETNGKRIDLNQNFRSRPDVLEATNYLFSQLMTERVGEIEYDEAAALKYGAQYEEKEQPAELVILYKDEEKEQVTTAQAEARFIIRKIQQLLVEETEVTHAFKAEQARKITYRDIVILMRSTTSWVDTFTEEFAKAGIPFYSNAKKGYFDAVEVMIMLNTLRMIDNPYQDVAVAAVLRSPFMQLTENELAIIRLTAKDEPFYTALQQFLRTGAVGIRPESVERLKWLMDLFEQWRTEARRGSLPELIWRVYTDTYYYEMVGTMPNGKQKQANLQALYDRAFDYEESSFRGLFRFLRFIERLHYRGDDLEGVKSMTDQDDVVRLMTTHASKGLEFPYVFIAGLGRKFNQRDFNDPYLFDRSFGLAVKSVDPIKRVMYTSLPFLAIREKKKLEMRAEEMRILYVAMTRAKEKLYLIGTVDNLETSFVSWSQAQDLPTEEPLAEHRRSQASTYIDWIGPAIARHQAFSPFNETNSGHFKPSESNWTIEFWAQSEYEEAIEPLVLPSTSTNDQEIEDSSALLRVVEKQFNWTYPHLAATQKRSKQSVSEVKRLSLLNDESEEGVPSEEPLVSVAYLHERPAFLQKQTLSAAEIGTAMHTVMQHIEFTTHTSETIQALVKKLEAEELLTATEAQAVNEVAVIRFFESAIGQRLIKAQEVYREFPFTYAREDQDGDHVIIQGIIDCLFLDEEGWVILDYKTDHLHALTEEEKRIELTNRYGVQLNLYRQAIEKTGVISIQEMVIYLLTDQQTYTIQEEHS